MAVARATTGDVYAKVQIARPDGTQGYAEFQRLEDGSLKVINAVTQSRDGKETPLDPAIVASIVNDPGGDGGKADIEAADDRSTDAAPPEAQEQSRSEFRNETFPSNQYRRLLGMPELYGPVATRSGEGTVAYAEIDGEPIVGVNSKAPGYTEQDRADANRMRDVLMKKYPGIMNVENPGRIPNNALFHGETTAFLRAARKHQGSLVGKTIIIEVDRQMCGACRLILPKIGLELGNPTVTFRDGRGNRRTMRNGKWERD